MISTTPLRPLIPDDRVHPMTPNDDHIIPLMPQDDRVLPLMPRPLPDPAGVAWGHKSLSWPALTPGVDWPDPELERLRRLEREVSKENEKDAIRARLRRMGVSEERIQGRPAWPHVAPLLPSPPQVSVAPHPTLDDVIRLARKGAGSAA